MPKYAKKSHFTISKFLILLGKPAFFLFTIIVVGFVSYIHLLKLFVQQFFHGIQTATTNLRKLRAVRRSDLLRKTRHSELFSRTPIHFGVRPGQILLVLIPIAISYSFYSYILKDLPSVHELSSTTPSLTTKIYDRNGELLYEIYKDENRSLIALSDLPPYLLDATLAAEDKNFYHHFGIDPVGILRATLNNFRCSLYHVPCSLQGGSTITQQLIKNTLLTPEKTLIRKIKELVLAVETELAYSKDEILEMYLNQVGYGGTAYGIEQASHQYFGKSARELSLSESAMLAGLPISPTALSPYGTNPFLGKIRQQQVLESMVAANMISENDKLTSLEHPLIFTPQAMSIRAPHFVMYIKDLLVKKYGEATVNRGGLSVTTTIDLKYQDILQAEINNELAKLEKLHVQNGAGLIISPKTGEILAMVGSHDFYDSKHDGQVNVVLQQRQPGSSIKPITYALALSQGLNPNSVIDDSPICFVSKGSPDYCPKNYDGRFHGSVTVRQALASSYNIPAVKILNGYGISNMISLARQMGITTWDDTSRYGLSLTLGGGEVTMMDLAGVYSVFANGGKKVPFNSIISIKDSNNQSLSMTYDLQPTTQVLDPSVAYQINSILSDPAARAPAFGTNSILNLPGSGVAVKTGTTNSLRDNWTFGYTENLLISTWVGNNDNTPMSSVASGITGASPIWARTMKTLLGVGPRLAFATPQNLVKINISCTKIPKYEYFVNGNVPKIDCTPKTGTILETAAATSQ
jgi:penicillin-binding protein 1C